jgi:hypothetical protein
MIATRRARSSCRWLDRPAGWCSARRGGGGRVHRGRAPPVDIVAEQLQRRRPCSCWITSNESSVWSKLARLARCLGSRSRHEPHRARLRAERGTHRTPDRAPVRESPATRGAGVVAAVQLFVDRARAVRYDFALTEATRSPWPDLPAPRRAAARHRARSGSPSGARGIARSARPQSRLWAPARPIFPKRQRTLRATVGLELGLLDDAGADAGHAVDLRRGLDAREPPCVSDLTERPDAPICSMRWPGTAW